MRQDCFCNNAKDSNFFNTDMVQVHKSATISTISATHFLQNNTPSDCKTRDTLAYIRQGSISRCHFLAIPKHWLPIGSTQPSGAQTHDCFNVDTTIRFKHYKNATSEFTCLQPKWKESDEEESEGERGVHRGGEGGRGGGRGRARGRGRGWGRGRGEEEEEEEDEEDPEAGGERAQRIRGPDFSHEIGATLVECVVNHRLPLREAGLRVQIFADIQRNLSL